MHFSLNVDPTIKEQPVSTCIMEYALIRTLITQINVLAEIEALKRVNDV